MKSLAVAAMMLLLSHCPAHASHPSGTDPAAIAFWQTVIPALQFGGMLAAGMGIGLLVCWLIAKALDATHSAAH